MWANWDSYPTILEDPANNYVAKQTFNENGVSNLIKMRCDGLTQAHIDAWQADILAVGRALNKKMTPEWLPEDEGHKVAHIKMKMPTLISNRSIITCFYRSTNE